MIFDIHLDGDSEEILAALKLISGNSSLSTDCDSDRVIGFAADYECDETEECKKK